jgi:hypothetical protein
MECVGAKIGNFLVDHRHSSIPPKIMLIAKCVDCPDLITVTKSELCSRLVIRVQMGILNAVLGFQTDPFDIVFLSHGMLHRPNSDMNGITVQLVNGDMLLAGSFSCSGDDFVHFFATTHNRNACIPDHGNDIAAMLADIEFLLHIISSFERKYVLKKANNVPTAGYTTVKGVKKWSKATHTKRGSFHTHWLLS